MTLDILRRTGGWCVELGQPLKGHDGEIAAIELRKPIADHIIRWGRDEIPSALALVSELCGVPERLIRQLAVEDYDRVFFAFMRMVPAVIREDLERGDHPMATPDALLPEESLVPQPDQQDPRFPAVNGPVRRLQPRPPPQTTPPPSPPPPEPETESDASPPEMNMAPPSIIQPVH